MSQKAHKRRRQQAKVNGLASPDQAIRLCNPVADFFTSFIAGNAVSWEKMALESLRNTAPHCIDELLAIEEWLPHYMPDINTPLAITGVFRDMIDQYGSDPIVAQQDSAKGQHVVICGAGPSLAEHAAEWCGKSDQLWGCNSALTWLIDKGYNPTHGFTVDQTADMLSEWHSAPDVEYLIASTCHPHLVDYLQAKARNVRFFHNYVGIKERPVSYDGRTMEYEDWMYSMLFPATMRAGSGLNAITRAIDIADFMGFSKITVLGADCMLRYSKPCPDGVTQGSPEHLKWLKEDVVMHADGGHALVSGATATTVDGNVDGRHILTKVDLMISAVFLVRMKRKMKDKLEIIGDTLPNLLKDKPESYLQRLPSLVDSNGKAITLI